MEHLELTTFDEDLPRNYERDLCFDAAIQSGHSYVDALSCTNRGLSCSGCPYDTKPLPPYDPIQDYMWGYTDLTNRQWNILIGSLGVLAGIVFGTLGLAATAQSDTPAPLTTTQKEAQYEAVIDRHNNPAQKEIPAACP